MHQRTCILSESVISGALCYNHWRLDSVNDLVDVVTKWHSYGFRLIPIPNMIPKVHC